MPSEKNPKSQIVTRFAPSPTGFMHVGGVRTALFAWLFARKNNGTFILRIEDTDKAREVSGSIEHIVESLKWLGIDWDEGPDIGGPNSPYKQSERLGTYQKHAQILIEKGLAYCDPYSEEEIEHFRNQAKTENKPFLYRNYRPKNPPEWSIGKPLRLKVDPQTTNWNDAVRGKLSSGPEALDDFILIKSDGYPTYNFAHIIDDYYMKTTHIFRADEFISSTPKFLALYKALDIKPPIFVTLPPIMGPDGKKKLGKRDGAKDLLDYKKDGILPHAMLNFLALIGWNPGDDRELMTLDEIMQSFEIEKIQTGGGKFNEEKLLWFNKEYIKNISDDEIKNIFIEKIKNLKFQKEDKKISKIIPIIKERISKFSDIDNLILDGDINYYFEKNNNYEATKLIWKNSNKTDTINHLEKLIAIIEQEKDFENLSLEQIKDFIWKYVQQNDKGSVLWPLRFALSGKEKSPDPFTLVYILGKMETIERIKIAIEKIKND
ncbi:MAG TPA: glutamate--tRNA ligase [Candidatus Paceibacterota bacterium]|nr:glutamate--tRNA ligase [Candidatus Paceibacterota bacterium]HMP18735.1 glutamate--tRNA ligase [Candidatus Paceibacterota bacterium]HMP85258.1 glutamate--tRNA ligase [Candidatus Paceibacterota bacterium]